MPTITSSLSIRVINSTQTGVSLKPQSPLEMAVREGEGKAGEKRRGREGRKDALPPTPSSLSMPLGAGLLAAYFPERLRPCPLPQALPRTLSAWNPGLGKMQLSNQSLLVGKFAAPGRGEFTVLILMFTFFLSIPCRSLRRTASGFLLQHQTGMEDAARISSGSL